MTITINKNSKLYSFLTTTYVKVKDIVNKIEWNDNKVPIVVFLSTIIILGIISATRINNNINSTDTISNVPYDEIYAQTNQANYDSSICSKLGINSAVQFYKPRDTESRNGLSWYLAIAETPDDITSSICSMAEHVIVRPWCDSANCPNFFTRQNEIAQRLASIGCEVYVTGPNEPISEMGSASAAVEAQINLINAVNATGATNIKILSPAFNATHPNRSSFVGAVSDGLRSYWKYIHGIALNTYTIPGGTVNSFYDDTVNIIYNNGGADSNGKPVYVTETGPIEQKSGVSRATALANLKTELQTLTNKAQAVLLFNGSGDNTDSNFDYGCIESDELSDLTDGQCTDSNIYCNGTNTPPEVTNSDDPGCCEFVEENSIKACSVAQVFSNNNFTPGLDQVNGGVVMQKVVGGKIDLSSLAPELSQFGYDQIPLDEERWVFKYAVTEHIHNIPLLSFLSSPAPTQSHNITPIMSAREYTNVSSEIDFGDQFPGIATFELEGGGQFQIQVPSLGTVSGIGSLDRKNYTDKLQPHCGLTWESNKGSLPWQDDDEPISLINQFLALINSEEYKSFTSSSKSTYLDELRNFIDKIQDFLNSPIDLDSCQNVCTIENAGSPIRVCDPTDGMVLPRDFYETIIEANILKNSELPMMDPLDAQQVCDLAFSGKVVGGACVTDSPIGVITLDPNVEVTNSDLINYAVAKGKASLSSGGSAAVPSSSVYEAVKSDNYEAQTYSGTPYYRIEFGKTSTLKLEGLLDVIEEIYKAEKRSFIGSDQKICHNNNVGIKVTSTKRLYDYFQTNNSADTSIPLDNGLDNYQLPPTQIFFARDVDEYHKPFSTYGMCDPKTYVLDGDEKRNQNPGIAITDPTTQAQTAATVEHYFPWIGQIPTMIERIGVWSDAKLTTGSNPADFTNTTIMKELITIQQTVESKERLNEDATITKEAYEVKLTQIREMFEEMKRINEDFINVYLFPCGFFNTQAGKDTFDIYIDIFYPNYSNNIIERVKIFGALVNDDCLCSTYDSDPLQNYLFANGKLEDELEKFLSRAKVDLPDMCSDTSLGDQDTDIGGIGGDPIDVSDMISPLKSIRITQDYGATSANYGLHGNFHSGIDLGGEQPVYAAADGKVIWAGFPDTSDYIKELGNLTAYGEHVLIEHSGGIKTRYAHMQEGSLTVKVGDRVKQGEKIGIMGTTGWKYTKVFGILQKVSSSSGIHLHFEIIKPNCIEWNTSSTLPWGKDCFINPTSLFRKSIFNPAPNVAFNYSSESVAVNLACEDYETNNGIYGAIDPDYKDPEGSFGDDVCLARKVANTLNNYNSKERIPWYVILAIWESETKRRCTPTYAGFFTSIDANRQYPEINESRFLSGKDWIKIFNHDDQCSGDPNQVALADVQTLDKDGKGIGGHLKGTFLAIIKNWYWYKPSTNSDNTGDLLEYCMNELGVDTTIGQEDSGEPYGAFWDWTNTSGYSVPANEKVTLKENFSRKRVGDALCAMAIQLAENAANKKDGYIAPSAWTNADISNAAYGYYGACKFGGGDYCQNVIERSKIFREIYENYDCNGNQSQSDFITDQEPEKFDSQQDATDGLTSCPYYPDQPYYIRQSVDGGSHSLCDYREYYSNEFGGYYQAVDINVNLTGLSTPNDVKVRAPVNGEVIDIVEPEESTYDRCTGFGTPYDGGWAIIIREERDGVSKSDSRTFRLLHVENASNYIKEGDKVKAGDQIAVLYDGFVKSGSPFNATGYGCFSTFRPHVHLTIINSDVLPKEFVISNCHAPSYDESGGNSIGWETPENTCCIAPNVCGCSIEKYDPANPRCESP